MKGPFLSNNYLFNFSFFCLRIYIVIYTMTDRSRTQSKRSAATNTAAMIRKPRGNYAKRNVKRRYPKSQRKAMISANRMAIAPCTLHYFKALHNPFTTPAGVCIPDGQFPLPSQKAHAVLKGQFQCGTTGYGFISFAPCAANNLPTLTVSSSASVGSSATLFSAYTNTGTGVFSRLPYTQADIQTTGDITSRVVAAGVRIRYAGAEQTRSGIIAGFEDQDHLDAQTRESFNTLLAQVNSASRRPSGDGDWDMSVCYSGPTAPNMVDFVSTPYPIKPVAGGADVTPIVIAIQGVAGDSYEFEAAIHVEYIGRKASGKTPTHSDNAGYNHALQAVKSTAAQKPLQPDDAGIDWKKYMGYAKEAISIAGGVATIAGLVMG